MHSRRSPSKVFCIHTLFIASGSFVLSGCDAVPVADPAASSQRPTTNFGDFPPVTNPVVEDDDNNNDVFNQAQMATMPDEGEFVIEGRISSLDDIDLYALGPAARGDRITLDVTGSSGINTVIALFDADMNLIDANDDRSYYAGMLDPYLSVTLRQDTSNMFVGIALSSARYFASSQGRNPGSYSIKLGRKMAQAVREVTNQLVYLDFEGGKSVTIAQQPVEQMRPFSAESISSRLAGQTDYIANLAVAHMRHDLEPFNVTLVSSKEGPEPAEPHSTLFFGNENQSFLGLADSVDTGNNSPTQEAIIYSEDLARWENMSPSADEIAMAVANIAAHELGHLLGMEHTNESGDMMAIATSASQVLDIDATYRTAHLEQGVFPTGWQDSDSILIQNVGTRPGASASRTMLQDLMPSAAPLREIDIPINMCGHCCEPAHDQ